MPCWAHISCIQCTKPMKKQHQNEQITQSERNIVEHKAGYVAIARQTGMVWLWSLSSSDALHVNVRKPPLPHTEQKKCSSSCCQFASRGIRNLRMCVVNAVCCSPRWAELDDVCVGFGEEKVYKPCGVLKCRNSLREFIVSRDTCVHGGEKK